MKVVCDGRGLMAKVLSPLSSSALFVGGRVCELGGRIGGRVVPLMIFFFWVFNQPKPRRLASDTVNYQNTAARSAGCAAAEPFQIFGRNQRGDYSLLSDISGKRSGPM